MEKAIRALADCSLAEFDAKRDGDWVTLGGLGYIGDQMYTEEGDPMMVGSLRESYDKVELLFVDDPRLSNALYVAYVRNLLMEHYVLVRGWVHKDVKRNKLVVMELERFEGSSEGWKLRWLRGSGMLR